MKQSTKTLRQTGAVVHLLFNLLVGLVIISPILYALAISFMQPYEILNRDIHLIPDGLYLGNYQVAVTKTPLFRFMFNSLVVSVLSSLVRVFICSLAAFAFAFYDFKGKSILFFLFLGPMMIPPDILIMQNFATITRLGLLNTYIGIMSVFLVTVLNIFVMRQNFNAYPTSLRDAAQIDGCTSWGFYWRILMPSSKPVLTSVFISSFIGVWNAYLWPLIVTNREEMRPVQVAVTMLNFPDASPYGAIMAASMLILLPSVLVFIIFQKKIQAGMLAGSVKG